MVNQLKQILIWSLTTLFFHCAWFSGSAPEENLIKPQPVGGYEALSARIHYPKALREQQIEGTVLIRAHISQNGEVLETVVSSSLHPELDQIVSNAVKRTPFVPASRNGEAAAVWIAIPFVFALKDWQPNETPFISFEMIIHPDQAYKSYQVAFRGQLKDKLDRPLRIECLLPYNHEHAWVKNTTGTNIPSGLVTDDQGEWLVFEQNERQVSFGFDYHAMPGQPEPKFQYGFSLNYTLPDWTLAMVTSARNLRFDQESSRIMDNLDGSKRIEYDMQSLEAYEMRFLEITVEK
jgi:TonB family protein